MDDIIKGSESIDRIPSFLFLIGTLSYITGVAINYLPSFIKGAQLDSKEILYRIIIAISWGIINGFITARTINWVLIESKMKFRIYSIESFKDRTKSVLTRILYPVTMLLIFPILMNILLFDTYANDCRNNNFFLKVIGTNVLLLSVLTLIAALIIYESMSHMKNLMSQLNTLISDDIHLNNKVLITNFDDIGVVTGKINSIIDRLSETFNQIKNLIVTAGHSGAKVHEAVTNSYTKTTVIKDKMNSTEQEIQKQVNNISSMIYDINSVLELTGDFINQNSDQLNRMESTSLSVKNLISSLQSVLQMTLTLNNNFTTLMNTFNESSGYIAQASDSIRQIGNTGKSIQGIVGIISDIADKTNLLSMNASIEAAHAGEQGKGFSVVAHEIRKLSQNTAQSAKNISTLIDDISERIANGNEIFKTLSNSFTELGSKSDSIKTLITTISTESQTLIENAAENLEKINNLLTSGSIIRKSSAKQTEQVTRIRETINTISAGTRRISDDEHQMNESISELLTHFSEISEASNQSFSDIEKLKGTVSLYKLD